MFRLYFAGTQGQEVETHLRERGADHLYSFHHDQKLLNEWWDNGGRPVFLDSGAFSVFTKGIQINLNSYIEYLNEHDDGIEVFASLDKIPGEYGKHRTAKDLAEAPEETWSNYLYIRKYAKSPQKCIPVFHREEDFKYLHQMLDTKFKGKHIPYIGLGGMASNLVPMQEKERWMAKVFKIIENSSNPKVKVHAFGMTRLKVLERFPLYSSDSTTYIMVSANGNILSEYGVLELSEKRDNLKSNVKHVGDLSYKELERYVSQYGYELETMMTNYKVRTKWNIDYLLRWQQSYKYNPIKSSQKTLF